MSEDSPRMEVPVSVLRAALQDGAVLSAKVDERIIPRPLTVRRIGALRVRSGRLVVGDVGMGFDMCEPFVRTTPPGEYDVFVSIWGLGGRGNSPSDGMGDSPRAAYLALLLSREAPLRYEFAATGDQPLEWTPQQPWDGFGVDVGGVGILDAEDLAVLRDLDEGMDLFDEMDEAYAKRPELAGLAGIATLPTTPPVQVPLCSSGWGDGSYFSYWGSSAAGKPVVLIVDFNLDGKFGYR